MRHRRRPQRPFSLAPNAQNVTMGEKGVHTHTTKTASNEKTPIHIRNQQVIK